MGKTAIKTARSSSVQKSIEGAKAHEDNTMKTSPIAGYVMVAHGDEKNPEKRAQMHEAYVELEATAFNKKNATQLPSRKVSDSLRSPSKAAVTSKPKVPQVVDLGIPERADQVSKALGGRTNFARLLRVSVSQPTRWIKGEESPNSENTRTIVDLEHVVTRARLLWGDDDVVNAWLTGRNGFLDGARPIDVITTQGSGPVIDALDQATAGAFA